MPKGRPRREPSARNLELYHELICEGRQQADVAARFRVSQPRVAMVRRQVSAWVDAMLDEDAGGCISGGDAGSRLHLAIALWRSKVSQAYQSFLNLFGGASGAMAYGHLLAACDAGLVPSDVAGKLPNRKFVESAVRMARQLDALAHVASRGPFASLPDELRDMEQKLATHEI